YIYDYALYDITGSQVKDLRNTNYTILGDSLFISSKTTKGASYILYVGGNTVKIGSTSTDKDDKSAFDTIACSSSYGYYYTAKSATDEAKGETVTTYTYYNEKGAKLASTTSALSAVTATDDYVVMGCREKAETKDANTGATKIEYKYTFYRFDIK
ncbi:MAG: hypothetical protein J6U68_02055, partial [Clostridia bacterium]|nr:hypothetical protein [Clostridia bacterium]